MPPGYTVVQCRTCGTKNRVPWQAEGVPRCGKCKSALPWIGEAGDDTFAEVVTASALPVLSGRLGALVRPMPGDQPSARASGQ